MSSLRFPNPVSDIQKFWETYRILFRELEYIRNFGHDEMTEIMVKNGLATSSGATGEEAKRRSYRKDRTRDPFYNQLKMYSELFRLLGWMHPDQDRTHFIMTDLGRYVAHETEWNRVKPLVKECILNIVFPNPHVENRGGHQLRPFPLLMKLIHNCKDVIFRDELIITVLNLNDDRVGDPLTQMTNKIKDLRGNHNNLLAELRTVSGPIQENTLKNYTRFPLGVLKSADWASSTTDKKLYSKALICYKLTPIGLKELINISNMIDIRTESLSQFSRNALYNFILLSNYSLLERAGYPLENMKNVIQEMESESQEIFDIFKIQNRRQILFSPFQQIEKDILQRVDEYEKETYPW